MAQVENVINPSLDSRKVDRMALRAEQIFISVAMVVTSIGFFKLGVDTSQKMGAPYFLAFIIGLIVAAASGFVTDYAFRHLLQAVAFDMLAWLHPGCPKKKQKLYFHVLGVVKWLFLTAIVAALFAGDWYSVQAMRDPFANTAKGTPTVDTDSFANALSTTLSATTKPMATQIKSLQNQIKDANKLVDKSNSGLVTLIKKTGNGWASTELNKKKNAATKHLRNELDLLVKEYNTALGENTKLLTSELKRVSTGNEEITEGNNTQRASLSGLFFYSGAGAKALSVLLRLFLVISFLHKNKELDINGDGVVDSKDVDAYVKGDGGDDHTQGF